jgi:hypothetical protein
VPYAPGLPETRCARLVVPASGVLAAARPGSVRGGGRERQRTGAATALVFSVRWAVGMCRLHRSSTVTVRRLVVVEAETVLRARVIAEERLGSLAARWAHVRGVAAAAELMAAGLATTDAEAVVAAAWLHEPDTYRPQHGLLVRTLVALVSRRRSRSGRVKGMPIVRVLRRVWIPPVVLTVIGCGDSPCHWFAQSSRRRSTRLTQTLRLRTPSRSTRSPAFTIAILSRTT